MAEEPDSHPWRQRRLRSFNYADPDHVYFVTLRARAGTTPFTDHRLADEVVGSLNWLREHAGLTVYAYVLMPDHLHVLLRPPGGEHLGMLLKRLKSFTTKQSWALGYKGLLWQARFHDHILRKTEDGQAVAAYILGNPERAGLVKDDVAYPYCGTPDPL